MESAVAAQAYLALAQRRPAAIGRAHDGHHAADVRPHVARLPDADHAAPALVAPARRRAGLKGMVDRAVDRAAEHPAHLHGRAATRGEPFGRGGRNITGLLLVIGVFAPFARRRWRRVAARRLPGSVPPRRAAFARAVDRRPDLRPRAGPCVVVALCVANVAYVAHGALDSLLEQRETRWRGQVEPRRGYAQRAGPGIVLIKAGMERNRGDPCDRHDTDTGKHGFEHRPAPFSRDSTATCAAAGLRIWLTGGFVASAFRRVPFRH